MTLLLCLVSTICLKFEATNRSQILDQILGQIIGATPEEMCIKLQQKIGNKAPKLFALERRANGEQWTVLEKHLNRWTKRNDFDYFIHKDLEGFLRRELDFFIKNEVLYLDDIIDSVPDDLNKRLAKLKAVKKIANKIILFLSQMEEFQKRLWLKKKFVIEANYCITLDRVPESFYAEISENKRQIEEWKKLFAIDMSTTHFMIHC